MKIDSGIQEKINAFAKANKFSRAKLESFVGGILQEIPQSSTQVIVRGGKPAKESTKILRDRFKEEYKKLPVLTSRTVSEVYGCSLPDASNLLAYYAKEGIIKPGKSIRVEGKRGRAATQFEVVKS